MYGRYLGLRFASPQAMQPSPLRGSPRAAWLGPLVVLLAVGRARSPTFAALIQLVALIQFATLIRWFYDDSAA